MQNPKLSIHGGPKAITESFKKYNPINEDSLRSAREVLESGVLSDFLGAPGSNFLGGQKVKEFEEAAARYFGSSYCVSFNSWTSGLIAAVGAIPNLEPGDEIITSPWTMSATAMAILHWNATPIFADIEARTFNLNLEALEHLVTSRTRAVLAVDIFGRSINYSQLRDFCDKHSLMLIGDSAQAPGALHKGQFVSQWADIGGYSLNYHKHLHTGEGGFALTDDPELARRMQLIRNHAESVVGSDGPESLKNMIGYNFRLGEIEAALAIPQLARLDELINSRISAATKLMDGLSGLTGLQLPSHSLRNENVFYILPFIFKGEDRVTRDSLVDALRAEGVPALINRYANVHRLPVFMQERSSLIENTPWVFNKTFLSTYGDGKCPVAEDLFNNTFFGIHMCSFQFDQEEIDQIVAAFRKVWSGLGILE
jgi:perosamine synthetase